MSLTLTAVLRGIADTLQEEALKQEEGSDAWALYQDAADALQDLADHAAETGRG